MKTDIRQIESLVEPLLESENAELVDLQYLREGGRWVLRFFLDKEGGLTLDDCAYFSDRIGGLLDSQEALEHSYVLEISSPGLDRVLKKEKDFARFAGKAVKVRLKLAQEGQRNFKGRLKGLNADKVVVDCEGRLCEFGLGEIDEARLDYAADLKF